MVYAVTGVSSSYQVEIVSPKRCLSAFVIRVLYELIGMWITSTIAVLLTKGFIMSICFVCLLVAVSVFYSFF